MGKKTKSSDINVTAFQILNSVMGIGEPPAIPVKKKTPAKNPAAVALGRLGGLKGGKARAKSLTKAQRIDIATKAANKRWKDVK